MSNAVPVLSFLRFCERSTLSASRLYRSRRRPMADRRIGHVGRRITPPTRSRTVSLRPHPTQSRTFPAQLVRLLPLLICLTGCAAIREPSLPQYFVLTLPASIGVFVLAAVVLMYLAFLGGIVFGERDATALLRAADSAAAKYQRLEIAGLLDQSSAIHDLTEDIVLRAHGRIHELRIQLEHLKKEQP